MSLIDALRHRLRSLTRPNAHARALDEELRFHLALDTMQREHGTPDKTPQDASFAARRRLGNVTKVKEDTRDAAGLGFLDMARQDVRFALRTFRRAPGFTAVAVLTLGVGIGANTAIFSAVDTMLIRPLPFADPSRLMVVSLSSPPRAELPADSDVPWSYPKFVVFRDRQTVFSDVALHDEGVTVIRGGSGNPERIYDERVSGRYFPTLGIRPAIGRNFLPDEDQHPGGPRVAILSDALWRRRFDADSAIVGRTIDLDGAPYTVVGVLGPGFRGMSGLPELWVPLMSESADDVGGPWWHSYELIARLRPAVSADQARAVVAQLGREVDAAYPNRPNPAAHWGAVARPLDGDRVDPSVRRSLLIVIAAVGLVLLIACTNVANLFLVRATGRRREIAVRLAVGAGRARLVRQLLTESLMLSFMGALASGAVAWWGVKLLTVLAPSDVARHAQNLSGLGLVSLDAIRLDGRALAFTAVMALGTGLVFGLVPALQATRLSFTDALKDDGAAARAGTGSRMLSRDVLAVVEIALSLVLLAGSGLMLRSLARLVEVDPGFRSRNLLTMRFDVPSYLRLPDDSLPGFYDQVLARLAAMPGVTGAALADWPPLSGGASRTAIDFQDRPPVPAGSRPHVGVHWVTPSWFAAFGVPLERGRVFTTADRAGAPKVVVVNAAAVRAFWPGEDPIGRRVGLGQGVDSATVVGVVGDVRFGTIDQPPTPDVYICYAQSPLGRMFGFVRTRGDPDALIASARAAVHEVAPDLPMYQVMSMDARVADATSYARFRTLLLALFALMALALATIGTYGVLSFAVAQRTREIGIRVALGATRPEVMRLVVGQGIRLAAIGIVCGLIAAAAATRVLRSLLYGVAPTDPVTFVAIVAVLLLAVVVASWLPARRAARIDPTEALRG